MHDQNRIFLFVAGIMIGVWTIASVVDYLLPWDLGIGIAVALFWPSIGFYERWYFSPDSWKQNSSIAKVHLYLKRRHFISATLGRWYTPPGIGSKLFGLFTFGGMYVWDTGDIHLNLPTIAAGYRKDRTFGGGPEPESIEDAVGLIIEHEAIHSAIHSCSTNIYTEVRDQFRSQFRQAGFKEKVWIVLHSAPFIRGGPGNNEEWAVDTLQRRGRAL